jgi:hypothetical protein
MAYRHFFPIGLTAGLALTFAAFGGCSSSSDTTAGTGGSAGTPATGTGGAPATGVGGSAATGGSTAAGGSSSTGGSAGTPSEGGVAAVPPVAACITETKGGGCTPGFPEGTSCYKPCGPSSSGYKLETCTNAVYVEGDCQYLTEGHDYSCYKTTPAPPACPTGTQASAACTMGTCMPCGGVGNDYLDSTGMAKTGYCVCQGNAAAPKWSCGSISSNSWPCIPPNTLPGCM